MGRHVNRREDWPERLAAFIEAARARPFSWGANDCMLFAADAIAAMTDVDLAAGFRGAYADEAGANAVLAPYGGIAGLLTAILGPPLDTPALAQRGDVVIFPGESGDTAAVVTGSAAAVFLMPGRLRSAPLALCRQAWRV
jgi:cell wall-associated NlpC family hydrolase